jgi:predicted SAM-dependent methyltransferase
MKEMSKALPRRQRDPNFITRYFVGEGIDIGGLPDPLSLYCEFFPLAKSIKVWDLADGDAQYMKTISNSNYDFVTSSHCLEHLQDPFEGIKNWFRILKPGGHLVITVPEEDLYEQGTWPSDKNLDHKHTFTIHKIKSWAPNSITIFDLVQSLGQEVDVRKIGVEDSGYRYRMPNYDQTMTPVSESAIEIILRKKTPEEMEAKVNRISDGVQPTSELRKYFNQYQIDLNLMKSNNGQQEPFLNEKEL